MQVVIPTIQIKIQAKRIFKSSLIVFSFFARFLKYGYRPTHGFVNVDGVPALVELSAYKKKKAETIRDPTWDRTGF